MTAARLTRRRASGNAGERLAVQYLAALGWRVLATQVAVGRDEIDIVAVEPPQQDSQRDPAHAPRAATLVFVEVRTHTTSRFGAPEESIDRRKVGRLYRSAFALSRLGRLPDGTALPRGPWRVDVLGVDLRPRLTAGVGGPEVRHIRAVTPS